MRRPDLLGCYLEGGRARQAKRRDLERKLRGVGSFGEERERCFVGRRLEQGRGARRVYAELVGGIRTPPFVGGAELVRAARLLGSGKRELQLHWPRSVCGGVYV